MNPRGKTYTLEDEATGDISPLTLSDDESTAEYVGADDTTMTLIKPVAEFAVQFIFKSEDREALTTELYNDGTGAVIYDGMGTVTEGTWSIDNSTALPSWTIELNETFENQPVEVSSDTEARQFSFSFNNGSGQLETVFVLTFEDYQAAIV